MWIATISFLTETPGTREYPGNPPPPPSPRRARAHDGGGGQESGTEEAGDESVGEAEYEGRWQSTKPCPSCRGFMRAADRSTCLSCGVQLEPDFPLTESRRLANLSECVQTLRDLQPDDPDTSRFEELASRYSAVGVGLDASTIRRFAKQAKRSRIGWTVTGLRDELRAADGDYHKAWAAIEVRSRGGEQVQVGRPHKTSRFFVPTTGSSTRSCTKLDEIKNLRTEAQVRGVGPREYRWRLTLSRSPLTATLLAPRRTASPRTDGPHEQLWLGGSPFGVAFQLE